MAMSKKLTVLISIIASLSIMATACGSTKGPKVSTSSTKKIDFTIMIQDSDDKISSEVVSKVESKFPNLNVISKQWDGATVEKTIKTSIAAGNPVDLAMYWPNQMDTFVNANMALDLTPYLEANNGAWKKTFTNGALKIGTYNNKVYAVPYSTVYPLVEVNKDIFDKAGVAIPDGSWTLDEFMKDCSIIKEKTGIYPIGINSSWASWTVRNGLLSNWSNKTKMEDFIAGKIPFTDPSVIKVFDSAKELYTKYAYPGNGAISATLDEVNMAFKQGKIAMKLDVNFLAAASIKNSGLKDIHIESYPQMGNLDYVLGGSNGYMIPANTQHKKEAVEVLKYITGTEVMQLYADAGTAVTVNNVKSTDPNSALYSKDSAKVYPKEILELSPEINDYFNNKMPANYIYTGQTAVNDLETLRQNALNAKK